MPIPPLSLVTSVPSVGFCHNVLMSKLGYLYKPIRLSRGKQWRTAETTYFFVRYLSVSNEMVSSKLVNPNALPLLCWISTPLL